MDLNLEHIRALADLANEKNLAEIKVESGEERITIKTPAAFVQSATVLAGHGGMSHGAAGGFNLPPVPGPVAAPPTGIQAQLALPPVQEPMTSSSAASSVNNANRHTITAPMVGTFYRAPSPESPAFVEVGQTVQSGQPLCIIEAMKLMNELESDVSGKVVEILVTNGSPVEYGQALFVVEIV